MNVKINVKINVKEYVKIRQEQLKQFEAHWLKMQSNVENCYPEELYKQDWFEQESIYLEELEENN